MSAWETINGKLTREYAFKNFVKAIQFVNEVAKIAEKSQHHPDILIHSYKLVRIELFTHSENRITEKDLKLAGEIDQLV